jgi:hypothetical protein
MKFLNITIFSIAMLLIPIAPSFLYATDTPADAVQHLTEATTYEQKAQEQEALIQKHEQMKKDYPYRFSHNPKYWPKSDLRWMNDHCDAIIQKAEALKAELLEFAKWHRTKATESQK